MKTYTVSAECAPKNSESWYIGCEGDEITAESSDEAQEIVSRKCAEAGTDTDPSYQAYGPYAYTPTATVHGWASEAVKQRVMYEIASSIKKEWDESVLEREIFNRVELQFSAEEGADYELSQHDTKSGHTELVRFDESDFAVEWSAHDC